MPTLDADLNFHFQCFYFLILFIYRHIAPSTEIYLLRIYVFARVVWLFLC